MYGHDGQQSSCFGILIDMALKFIDSCLANMRLRARQMHLFKGHVNSILLLRLGIRYMGRADLGTRSNAPKFIVRSCCMVIKPSGPQLGVA